MGQNQSTKTTMRLMRSTGDELSLLGFGCMRFPKKGARIDSAAVERLVRHAIDCGVNYFDTAYLYPGSEDVLGTVLAKTGADGRKLRDSVKIATKLPQLTVKTRAGMDEMIATSLKRLKTDYIDYYLVHNLSSFADWEKMKGLGICNFIEKQRQAGRIRHIGFSWHGNLSDFRQVVDDYEWEFCQIQYNYLDESIQAGTLGLKHAAEKGLGIVIMEPLRGGTLAGKLPLQAARIISDYKDENGESKSAAYWALRWVMDKPEVSTVLSGMNAMEQLEENIAVTANVSPGSFSERDSAMIASVADVYKANMKVPCTGCAYCVPCPHGVDIPTCFAAYNGKAMFGGVRHAFSYLFISGGKNPTRASQCKKCGSCEKKCPQHINIMDELSDVAKAMEPLWLKAPIAVALKIIGR